MGKASFVQIRISMSKINPWAAWMFLFMLAGLCLQSCEELINDDSNPDSQDLILLIDSIISVDTLALVVK